MSRASARAIVRVAAALLAGGIAAARAQPATMLPEGGVPGPGGTRFNVGIANAAGQPIRFQLRPRDGAWAEHQLAAEQSSAYACTGCGGTFEIRVSTAGTVLTYDLKAGRRYLIRVNPERNVYDVYAVE